MRFRPFLASAILILLPTGAFAQSDCARLYEQWELRQLVPVSQYTQDVLERAQNGMALAENMNVQGDFGIYLPDWAKTIQAAWGNLVQSDLRLTMREQSLAQSSACLHVDVLLIECAMDEVRIAMENQLTRGSISGIAVLQELLEFLNERILHLTLGSLDPLYQDPTWYRYTDFDSPTLSTAPSTEPASEQPPVCPYDADYAPAFPVGFGCDIETMEPFASFAPLLGPLRAELAALRIIDAEVTARRETARAFLGIQQEIDEIFERESPLPPPPAERKHLPAFGCGWNGGVCLEDRSVHCTTNDECREAGAGTCAFPQGICSGNRIVQCLDDEDCEGVGLCIQNTQGLPPTHALRGPFSLEKDQLAILNDFLDERSAQELSRSFKTDLQTSTEIPAGNPDLQEQRLQEEQTGFAVLRNTFRSFLQSVSRIQSTRDTPLFVRTVDPQREVQAALAPLQDSVSRIARLARDQDGLRAFVLRYTSFLRRTCIYRPCNSILDRVLKTAFADECFPYTNGEFLTDTEANPRWKQCKDAIDAQ